MLDLTQFEGHTPGPWYSELTSMRGHCVWGPLGNTGSMLVAACGFAEFDRVNAVLIQAAPALLAEIRELRAENVKLRDFVRATDNYRLILYTHPNDQIAHNTLAHEVDDARAAIGKLEVER